MANKGQFDIPGNTRVKCEFPCPKCGAKVEGTFKIKPDPHADETAVCSACGKSSDIIITHDAGTGTVDIPALGKDQSAVKARGLP
ncbi:MAG: hypothetical protein LBH16_05220 [Treponema sp.]|jgi:transcription elongation factor Elf1|nr:hypothetical protein [Treponema sp.]